MREQILYLFLSHSYEIMGKLLTSLRSLRPCGAMVKGAGSGAISHFYLLLAI
jgi:hypothetical protein